MAGPLAQANGYSPASFNEGLLGLVGALRAGMDPQTAYGIYGDLQSARAGTIAARQSRLSGLTDMLMQGAENGQTLGGASAMLNALPGGQMPGAQNALSALYPTTHDTPGIMPSGGATPMPAAAPLNSPGGPITPAIGDWFNAVTAGTPSQTLPTRGATSPVMPPPNPYDALHQQAQASIDQATIQNGGVAPSAAGTSASLDQQNLQAFLGNVARLKASGMSPTDIMGAIQGNPALQVVLAQNANAIYAVYPELQTAALQVKANQVVTSQTPATG